MKLIALAALAAMPAFAGTAAAQQAPQTLSVVQGADPSIWDGKADGGTLVHRATGIALPEEFGGLRRSRVSSLNGEDVAVSYRLSKGGTETAATLYLFKPKALPEHRLKGSIASFAELSPEAFVWSSGPFQIDSATPLRAYKGTFKTGIGPGTVMDYLYFVALGEWTIKVRGTINGVKDIADEARLDEMVRALPWAAILAANGQCTGVACSRQAVEEVEHHIMQTTLGRMIAEKSGFDKAAEARLPVVGQADGFAGKAEIRRSDAGLVAFVTSVEGLSTYRLLRFPVAVNLLLTDSFGRLSVDKPLYGLAIDVAGTQLIPRLYHGEPTAEAFGKAVNDLILMETPQPMLPVAKLAERMPD